MADLASYLPQDLKMTILDLLKSRYGQTAIEMEIGIEFDELEKGSDETFSKLLSNYSGDSAIRNVIYKWYLDLGHAMGQMGMSGAVEGDLMDGWDDKSKAILWHIYQNRHAGIEELSKAIGASHYEVLSRIKEVIIPESEKMLGAAIVKFEQSRMDLASGEKVCFSWWMADERPVLSKTVELFKDPDRVLIIANMPDMNLGDPLNVSARYKNGVLEVAIKL